MRLWKKLLHSLWGVDQPTTEMAPPLDCERCRVARMNGKDACFEHHNAHPRAHTYHIGGGLSWGSGLDQVGDNPPPSSRHSEV
jgi:hypothetical protein